MEYNLITITDSTIRYSTKNNTFEYPLIEDTFNDGVLVDTPPFLYIINKVLNKISLKEDIVIRLVNKNSLIRVVDLPNLTVDEANSYFDFNKEDIIPFNTDNLEIKTLYSDNQLVVGGINKDIYNHLNELTKKYKNIFLTTFPLEVISSISDLNHKNIIYFNLESDQIEFVYIVDNELVNYKHIPLGFSIDYNNFDIQDIKNSLIISSFKNTVEDIIKNYEDLNCDNYKVYSTGNKNIWGILEQVNPRVSLFYREFKLNSYFR